MKWRVALLQFIAVQDCYSLMGEIERGQGKVNGLWWVVVGRRQKGKQIPIDRSLLSFSTGWKPHSGKSTSISVALTAFRSRSCG